MKDSMQVSHIPEEWGGPFVWFHNDRGNLELVSVAKVTETLTEITDIVRAHVAEVAW